MQRILKILPLSFLLIASAQAKTIDYMYHIRYCEVVMGQREGTDLNLGVYNTYGYNTCPQAEWDKLSVSQLQQQYPGKVIMLNGPRYFMLDRAEINSTLPVDIKKFGGLTMRRAAILHLPVVDAISKRPYTERVVDRDTRWFYDKGRRVYELRAPDQKRYILQSYSDQIKKQTPESLQFLGNVLQLPVGWKFSSYILEKPLTVSTVNGKAYVIQDDLHNTYQRLD